MGLTTKLEIEKRIRCIKEWIIDDWPEADIRANIIKSWKVSDRQARRYLNQAIEVWSQKGQAKLDEKRQIRIQSLKKLKRSLSPEYRGTPAGIFAILAVEKKIIDLEGLEAAKKVELSGKGGGPIQQETMHRVIFEDYGEIE